MADRSLAPSSLYLASEGEEQLMRVHTRAERPLHVHCCMPHATTTRAHPHRHEPLRSATSLSGSARICTCSCAAQPRPGVVPTYGACVSPRLSGCPTQAVGPLAEAPSRYAPRPAPPAT
mmetsp:Transcript_12574/g.32187  ORF Transcript_12574/g.32187 Transcript_12574/m.32187 type:complete len:119 (+) Transcript_12574:175-531(+)